MTLSNQFRIKASRGCHRHENMISCRSWTIKDEIATTTFVEHVYWQSKHQFLPSQTPPFLQSDLSTLYTFLKRHPLINSKETLCHPHFHGLCSKNGNWDKFIALKCLYLDVPATKLLCLSVCICMRLSLGRIELLCLNLMYHVRGYACL